MQPKKKATTNFSATARGLVLLALCGPALLSGPGCASTASARASGGETSGFRKASQRLLDSPTADHGAREALVANGRTQTMPSRDELISLGDHERSMGEYGKAHLAYVRAHFSDKGSIAPLERIAYLTLRTDPAAASRLFGELLGAVPDDASVLVGRAYAELAQGKIGPARTTLEKAIQEDPSSSAAHAALAIVHDAQRHHPAAMASNARASEASAPTLQILNNQGFSSLMAGDSRRAADFFRQANVLSPESEIAANNLGLALALQGYDDAAFEAFLLHGSRGDALNNLGLACFLRGDSSKARELFEEALLTSETDELRVLRNLKRIDGLATIR